MLSWFHCGSAHSHLCLMYRTMLVLSVLKACHFCGQLIIYGIGLDHSQL